MFVMMSWPNQADFGIMLVAIAADFGCDNCGEIRDRSIAGPRWPAR